MRKRSPLFSYVYILILLFLKSRKQVNGKLMIF